MNRRTFFSRIIAVGVAVGLSNQTILAWTPSKYRNDLALQFMRKEINEYYKTYHRMPVEIVVGPALFAHIRAQMVEAVKGIAWGLLTRPSYPRPNFMFKGIVLSEVNCKGFSPWSYSLLEIHNDDPFNMKGDIRQYDESAIEWRGNPA